MRGAADVEVTVYDAGEGGLYPTEQWTVHFFKWLRACERGGPDRRTGRSPQALGCGLLGVGIRFSFGWLPGICLQGMDCWELLLVD